MDPGTRRFVSIVLVAMLLLVALLSVLTVLPSPEGDGDGEDEDPGWNYQEDDWGEWILVYDDVTWSGWDQAMPYPVYVDNGVTLTIEDSHLRVPLETMVFKEMPPFHVEWGGKLVLRNTTVEVEADPRLATAYMDVYTYASEAPVLWRVLNLREAVEPVLEVDVEFMRGRSWLVVAAQMTPFESLKPLEVLEPDEMDLFEWTTLEVSLADYAGGTPRVAVFFHNSSPQDVLVSGLRVTDGGSPLPGEIVPSGDMLRDGWTEEHLSRFLSTVDRGEYDLNQLVFCLGDLKMEDSRLLSLPGLDRNVPEYRPNGFGEEVTAWRTPEEGCVNVTGNVTILSSEMAYVPLKWTGGTATLEGCSFSGDCDLVTLAGREATVRDCSFSFEEQEGLWGSGLEDSETWMLALEHLANQAPVEGCTFTGEGEGIGLVVNGASVVVDYCSFSDLALGVWDHQSMVPLTWGGADPTVTFSPSCRLYYLETREVRVELNGPGEPDPWERSYTYWEREYLEEVPGLLDLYMMEARNDHYSLFSLPTTVVGPTIGEMELYEVEVSIRPRWADHVEIMTIDPHEGSYTLWVYEDDHQPNPEEHYVFWECELDVGEDVGTIQARLGVIVNLTYFSEPYLNVSVDGALVDRMDLNESVQGWPDNMGYVVVEQAIPPGAHNLTITAGSTYTELDWVIEMDSLTVWVYRASESGSAEEAMEWLDNRSRGALMVDSGAHLDGVSYEEGSYTQIHRFYVLTWEGAEVDVDRISATGYWDMVTLAGNGSVSARDVYIYAGTLQLKNVTATIEDLTSEAYMAVYLYDAKVSLRDTVEVYDIILQAMNGSTLTVEGADFDLWSDANLWIIESNGTVVDCDIHTHGFGRMVMSTAWWSNLLVEGCRFIGVPLDVNLYDMNDTVSVTGCAFEGRRGRLAVLPSEWVTLPDPEGQVPFNGTVSGNVLTGAGADLVVDVTVRDRLLGENQLRDGARAYVLFEPEAVVQGGSRYIDFNVTTLDAFVYDRAGPAPAAQGENRFNLLVDVTEDPLDPTDPGPVTVVVRIERNHLGPTGGVVGFADVDLSSPVITVQVLDWGDMQDEIRLLERAFNIEDNWWTS